VIYFNNYNDKMVALTKLQAKDVLKFILTHILEDDEDDGSAGPIQLALRKAKVKGILGLNSMPTATLETLSYDDVTTKLNVPLEQKGGIVPHWPKQEHKT
jgi:hypothetical protein